MLQCAHAMLQPKRLLPGLAFAAVVGAACGSDPDQPIGPDGGAGTGSPGQPEAWLSLDSPASDLACDDTHLYFAEASRLRRAALADGQPETLYEVPSPGENYLWGIESIYLGPNHVALVWISTELVEPYPSKRHLVIVPKQGGPALTLQTSADVRAYLGASFHDEHLYFSSFTSVFRAPIAGGDVEFVAESPGSVSYWIFSPLVLGDELYWAEDTQLYRMGLGSAEKEGENLATLPGVGKIVGNDGERFVVALSPAMAFQEPASSFAVVDISTGQVSASVPLGAQGNDFAVDDAHVWVAIWGGGLARYPLAGGAATPVIDDQVTAVTAADDHVYAATETEIWRIPR